MDMPCSQRAGFCQGSLTCRPGWPADAGTCSSTTLVSGKPSPAAGSSCGCSVTLACQE